MIFRRTMGSIEGNRAIYRRTYQLWAYLVRLLPSLARATSRCLDVVWGCLLFEVWAIPTNSSKLCVQTQMNIGSSILNCTSTEEPIHRTACPSPVTSRAVDFWRAWQLMDLLAILEGWFIASKTHSFHCNCRSSQPSHSFTKQYFQLLGLAPPVVASWSIVWTVSSGIASVVVARTGTNCNSERHIK